MISLADFRQRQSAPLESKVAHSLRRIREWIEHWDGRVYCGFSGGKDSTVLRHLIRLIDKEVPSVFCDTGLEYPEIKTFIATCSDVITVRPAISFRQVIEQFGYAVVSKRVAKRIRVIREAAHNTKATRRLYLKGIRRDGTYSSRSKLADCYRKLLKAPFKISEKCCDVLKKDPAHAYEKKTGRKPLIGILADESLDRRMKYM